jgi:hypothetical protein
MAKALLSPGPFVAYISSEDDLIDVTPPPVLSGLEGLDDGMLRRVKMLGRVTILRVIAASDVSARQAQSEVHPSIAHLQTFLASLSRWGHLAYLIQMFAGRHHTASGSVSYRKFDNRLVLVRLSVSLRKIGPLILFHPVGIR